LALAAVLSLAAILFGWEGDGGSSASAPDPSTLTVGVLFKMFHETREYLRAASWHMDGDTYAPNQNKPLERRRSRSMGFQRYIVRTPRRRSCGSGRAREVHHITATMPDVDPIYVMDVLVNPGHGVSWNPSVRRVVLRSHQRLSVNDVLPGAFTPEEVASKRSESRLSRESGEVIDVTGQVTEVPLPRLVQRVTGPRFSSDFIAARFDCNAKRGFTLATSHGTEALAAAAEVTKGQELCFSAVMVAPAGGTNGNGSILHIVTHFDPQVPSKPLRKVVSAGVGRTLRDMLRAMYNKARTLQAAGSHSYIDCP